jgi:hypothetical protein
MNHQIGGEMIALCLAQLPVPAPGSMESWLISATAVVSMALVFKKFLSRKSESEGASPAWRDLRELRAEWREELRQLREGMETRRDALNGKLDAMKMELLAAGEKRCDSIHRRLSELEAGLARVDERTLRRDSRNYENKK